MRTLLIISFGALLGFIMGSFGVHVDTWQFWAMTLPLNIGWVMLLNALNV